MHLWNRVYIMWGCLRLTCRCSGLTSRVMCCVLPEVYMPKGKGIADHVDELQKSLQRSQVRARITQTANRVPGAKCTEQEVV